MCIKNFAQEVIVEGPEYGLCISLKISSKKLAGYFDY